MWIIKETTEWIVTLHFAWKNRVRIWNLVTTKRKQREKEHNERIRRMKIAMDEVLDEMEQALERGK